MMDCLFRDNGKCRHYATVYDKKNSKNMFKNTANHTIPLYNYFSTVDILPFTIS